MEDRIRLELPRLHAEQQKIIDDDSRWRVIMAGRRGGKSTMARVAAVLEMLQGKPVLWLESTYRRLMDSWRELQDLLHSAVEKKSEEEKRLVIRGGGSLDMWSAEAGEPSRGRGYSLAVIDEAGLIPNLMRVWQQAVRPSLSDYAGRALILGTPRRAAGDFAEMFSWGETGKEGWKSFRFGSAANIYLPAGEVEQARRELPLAAFQQEYLGLPIAAGDSAVFRDLDRAIIDAPLPAEYAGWTAPTPYQTLAPMAFWVGADWAGAGRRATGDYTAFVTVASDGVVCDIQRFKSDFQTQRNRLASVIQRYRPAAVLAESNSIGSVQLAEARLAGLDTQGFTTTAVTKAKAVELLAAAFDAGQVKLYDIPNRDLFLSELAGFEAVPLQHGLTRYAAAGSSHDDLVIAMLLAWTAGHRGEAGWMGPSDGVNSGFLGIGAAWF
jgi:hypothetical protein